jgi:hypothetical protein
MGERVHVRAVRAEPVGGGGSGAGATTADDGVRIDYAKSDVNPRFPKFWATVAWVRYVASEVAAALRPRLVELVRTLGGGRQLLFAFGMMCALGGVGAALSPRDRGPAFWMAVGGIAIGLAVRLPPAAKG